MKKVIAGLLAFVLLLTSGLPDADCALQKAWKGLLEVILLCGRQRS